jgi:hypothetical protein
MTDYIKFMGGGKPGVWNKIPLMQRFMSRTLSLPNGAKQYEYSWIWMMDYDIIIMNEKLDLHTHVFEQAKKKREESGLPWDTVEYIIAKDCNGMNAGSFFIRVSEWSIEFLKKVWDIQGKRRYGFEEQGAMQYVLEDEEFKEFSKDRLLVVDQSLFNAYPISTAPCFSAYKEGDLLVHFPGDKSQMDSFINKYKETHK